MAKIKKQKGTSTYTLYRRKMYIRNGLAIGIAVIGVLLALLTRGISLILLISLLFYKRDNKKKVQLHDIL